MPISDERPEAFHDFVTETKELLESIDTDLLELEKNPENFDLVNKVFRSVHTIKGAAGFLGFDKIVEIVHSSENVLNKCRQGDIKVTPNINDTIFSAIDQIKSFIDDVSYGRELTDDTSDLISDIKACLEIDTDEILNETVEEVLQETDRISLDDTAEEINENLQEEEYETSMLPSFHGALTIVEQKLTDNQLKKLAGTEREEAVEASMEELPKREKEAFVDTTKERPEKFSKPKTKTVPTATTTKSTVGGEKQTVRVNVERLDLVLNLVGEMVLGRNRIMQIGQQLEVDHENDTNVHNLMETISHINMITTDLQSAVMKTRMQPIKKIFNRFPRMIRDIAKGFGKDIEMKIEGEETELDKSVVEAIGDPLVHLIRNSVDHGIELPDIREANGKPRKGTISLLSYHDGNHIVIEVHDDGAGIDAEKIASVAVSRGIIQEADIEKMSEKEKLNLIFAPGFSTMESTTDMSGRGVGLDVVRTNVVKLNGTININTTLGEGTTFSVKLPLTLAIIKTLMVTVGEESFALPLSSIIKTVRIHPDTIQSIEMREVIDLADELLPLIRLSDLFDIEPSLIMGDKDGKEWLYVVVVVIAEKKVGIVVEKLCGQEEVVIKSLGKHLQPKGIAGATILGDGRVTLIVDLGSLMEMVEEGNYRDQVNSNKESKPDAPQKLGGGKTVLIVDDSAPSRKIQRKILESGGFKVLEAKNGVEGLKILEEEEKVDLVVTDILMPSMDGIEMSRQIKASQKHRSLPIIALTVIEEKEMQVEGFKAGINEFFYKTDISGMLSSVHRYIH